jgi:hypothetical protein
MQEQLATPQSFRHAPKSATTQQMIANVQVRLRRLEEDKRELSAKMKQFANQSDISALTMSVDGSAVKSRHYTPSGFLSPLTPSPALSRSRAETEVDTLRKDNEYLRSELAAEQKRSQQLQRGFVHLVECTSNWTNSLTAQFSEAVETQSIRLDRVTRRLPQIRLKTHAQTETAQRLSAEVLVRRAEISDILNNFKSWLSRVQLSVASNIRSQNPVSRGGSSSDSIFKSPVDPRRNLSSRKSSGNRSAPASVIQQSDPINALARACDELSSRIVTQFGTKSVVRRSGDLVKTPQAFAEQINSICSMQDLGIQGLKDEIDSLHLELQEAKATLQSRELSPAVAEAVKAILASLADISNQMHEEYESLISKLT